jgi:prepilin-type processing-associated H-X9-DG protein
MYLDDNDGFFYRGINHNYDFGGWKGIGTSARHRPLNRYFDLPLEIETENGAEIFKCPSDEGGGDYGPTAYLRFGNSYQANIMLVGPDQLPAGAYVSEPWKTINQEINKHLKGLNRASILEPAHLLLVGDRNWLAQWDPLIPSGPFGKSWHGKLDYHNLAFFDGHVDLVKIRKGLYITPEYRVQPFKKLDGLVGQLQEEIN